MILIKKLEDIEKIPDEEHKAKIYEITRNLIRTQQNLPPDYEDRSYSIYIENKKDNIRKGVPHCNDEQDGLLCNSDLWTPGNVRAGWCWEAVTYYPKIHLYEIVIIINNEMGVGFFVPEDFYLDKELEKAMKEQCDVDNS